MRNCLFGLVVLLLVVSANAQEKPILFTGATLYRISDSAISDGALLVHKGRIVAVDDASGIKKPADVEIIDVKGKFIMPGLVDTHSHIGNVDGGDGSATLHPDVRVLDAVDVRSATLQKARAGGITTVNIMSGSGHLMSGQTIYVKLRKAKRIEQMLFCDDVLTDICGGMKMANGTNSLRDKPFSGTRAKSAALVRQLFLKGQAYQNKLAAATDDSTKAPERDLQMEALLQVLAGKRIVQHHTHRHDDIMTVLRLRDEFGFKVVLHHVSEGWKVADEIAAAQVPVSAIVLDAPGGKLEAVDLALETCATLENAGVDVGFHTDDPITDSRLFLRSAGLAVRGGMSPAGALEALTLAGARMLALDDRLGSLEVGKDADFIILSAEPLSVYAKVEQTWIEGNRVFDRANPEDRKYAVGGYGVYRAEWQHHCEEIIR